MDNNALLSPPLNAAVSVLKDGATSKAIALRGHAERTTSALIKEEGEELREAAEQSMNIILDLDLDSKIRWVSPSWQDFVGSTPESVRGRIIGDLLPEQQKDCFPNAIRALQKDDSGSKVVRFSVRTEEPTTIISETSASQEVGRRGGEYGGGDTNIGRDLCGTRGSGHHHLRSCYWRRESTPMWMVRPFIQREITIDLPDIPRRITRRWRRIAGFTFDEIGRDWYNRSTAQPTTAAGAL